MSTKINGYIFDKNYTFEELFEWCKESKKIFVEELNKKAKNDYIKIATKILDMNYYLSKEQLDIYVNENYFLKDLSHGFYPWDIHYIAKEFEKKGERLCNDFDYKLECSIHSSKEHKLIMFFGDDFGLLPKYKDDTEIELIEGKINHIKPFDYYDNVDHEIDDKLFEKRGQIWKEALPTGIPSNDGFIFKLTDYNDIDFYLKNEKIVSTISYEDRIKDNIDTILNMVFDNKFKKLKIEVENKNLMSLYLKKYKEFKKSEDYKLLKIKVGRFLKSKLPENYDNILGEPINFDIENYKYKLK